MSAHVPEKANTRPLHRAHTQVRPYTPWEPGTALGNVVPSLPPPLMNLSPPFGEYNVGEKKTAPERTRERRVGRAGGNPTVQRRGGGSVGGVVPGIPSQGIPDGPGNRARPGCRRHYSIEDRVLKPEVVSAMIGVGLAIFAPWRRERKCSGRHLLACVVAIHIEEVSSCSWERRDSLRRQPCPWVFWLWPVGRSRPRPLLLDRRQQRHALGLVRQEEWCQVTT